MNIKLNKVKRSIKNQKKIYLLLGIIFTIGMLIGLLLLLFLSKNDKKIVVNEIYNFFNSIKNSNNINYSTSLLNSLFKNGIYVLSIWLFGLSVIGLPIVIIMLMFKGFIFGFSISSIIYTYKIKGILGAFLYIFPHQILYIIIYLVLSFYSVSFSYRLFSYLFLKKNIDFRKALKKYIKILIISILLVLVLSFYETYLSTYFMKFFTMILK